MTSTANTFNSVGGFSVGIPPVPVVDGNANVVTNVNTTGNVTANVVYATYYKLANGAPFTGTPGGIYNQLQFNNSGSFGGVPNVTWNGSALSLGSVSNLSIGGGTNGYVLQTDGAGNLTWTAQSGNGGGNGVPGGTNTQIQFNNAGSFGGASGFTFNNATGLMTVPNTSVGNITAISSLITLGTANLGAVSNVTITGGSANYVLATDGAGNLSWVAQTAGGGGTPGGSNTQVQYNNSGNFAGSPNFTFNAATGALTANTFVGSGANLSNISAANVIGIVANATHATIADSANSVAGANVSGVVANATYATSAGTATTAGTANSVAGANVSGTVANATYATSAGTATTAGTANSVAGANVSGPVAYATTANSVAGANVSGTVANATRATTAGTANSVAGANVSGPVAYATTANSVAGANVSGTVANATYATSAGTATTAGTANSVAGANVSGTVANATYATSAGTAATVTTATQPNITSVGNLTSLGVIGISNLGPVGNVKITGGTNGYVLQTDGAGNLTWTAQSGNTTGNGVPGGSNTQVQFNNAGNFAGTAGFTFDSTSNTLTATNISGNGSGISSITGANVTGTVANATYATNAGSAASANSVAGANVSGTVANATYALTSNSSTYADQATYAGTANAVAGANVSGTVANATYATSAGSADSATTASTVTTNAQPNITSVGSLANLTVTGNASFTGSNTSLGNVSNLHITGGTVGYVLQTDGAGNLTWTAQSGNASGNSVGNAIPLGTPTDGNLTTNVAYSGWTTSTYVTDGLDDLNQVILNIAGNTFVGNIYIGANVTSGPSPLIVAFTGNYIGNPTNYLWDFGDGTTSTSRNPTKTYSNTLGGNFTVAFTAYNVNGTYSGNAANGAKGSSATSTNTAYIRLYTPVPLPSFTTSPTSLNTGNLVTLTNTSLYATSYTINYGDGNTAVNPGNSWTTTTHAYTAAANVDTIYGINLTGTNQTAGNAPPYSVTTANTNVKVYTQQSPAFTANSTSTINYLTTSGGVISFRNDTPGTPGNTASFGAQQLYNYRWGDGTANSNINIQSGLAGNPGAANITHAFALSSAQQNAATTVSYVTNLSLYTGYSTSPFLSSNITITVEPEVRANFVGTSNTQTDATGYSSNAQVGYLYTDYNGRDRSLFNFRNDTSPNVTFTGNVFNWTWGDTTSNTGITNTANISHSYLNDYGSPTVGSKTVALQANGTPGTTSQSNTNTKTSYITILANPTAPSNLSSYTNVTIATASQGTSPLLAAGANDNTGGNIVANGTSVTRVATTTPVSTSTQVTNANTALAGTLTAYVNNTASGNASFSTGGNAVGTYTSLIVSADRDLHVANAAVPTGFYKVFSATISNTLASLGNGYNDFQLRHSTTGNTNAIGMVKDNLNSAPTLVTTNTAMVTAVTGTYRYISGIPYYSSTGSPAITVATLELQNFTGQTFCSADPFTVASGTSYEGSGSVISTQTKTLAQIDNSANSMLTGSNVKANIGISTNYSMGNLNVLLNGAVNGVATLAANIFNVVGTSTTIQLPTKIQMYAGANSGFDEQSITANVASNTQPAIRVVMSTTGNTPAFSGSINYYTSNAWSGAQTIQGTTESVVRYGVLNHYAVDLSTGYLPVGPDLATGRSGLQYFTLAFVRPSLANFDIILTTGSTGISGLWVAAPGTTIDTGGFSSPTAGYPGPTSTINGWLTGYEQYNGAGVPGNSATGGNPAGTNGCALTGADVIPLNTQISNVRYTMTLGSQNQANSFGNNILIRIALAAGQTITDLQIGVAM